MKGLLCSLILLLVGCLSGTPTAFSTGAIIGGDSWVFWDGDVLVGRGDTSIEAGVWLKASGFPVVGPVIVPGGETLVVRKSDKFYETYANDAPIPYWAVFAFPGGAQRAAELGVTFVPPNP